MAHNCAHAVALFARWARRKPDRFVSVDDHLDNKRDGVRAPLCGMEAESWHANRLLEESGTWGPTEPETHIAAQSVLVGCLVDTSGVDARIVGVALPGTQHQRRPQPPDIRELQTSPRWSVPVSRTATAQLRGRSFSPFTAHSASLAPLCSLSRCTAQG